MRKPIVDLITFEQLKKEIRRFLDKDFLYPSGQEFRQINRDAHRGVQLVERNSKAYMKIVSYLREVNDLWIDLNSSPEDRGFIGKVILVKACLDFYFSPSNISFVEVSEKFKDVLKAVEEFLSFHDPGEKFAFQDLNFIDWLLDIIPEKLLKFRSLKEFNGECQARILRRRRVSGLYKDKSVDRYDLIEEGEQRKLIACKSVYLEKMMRQNLSVKLDVWELRTLLGVLLIATGGLDGVHRSPQEIREMVWKKDFEVKCSRVDLLTALGISRNDFLSYPVQEQIRIVKRLEAALENLACITFCLQLPGGGIGYRNLLQEMDIIKRGRGSPVIYRIVPVTRFFKEEFLRRFIAITPEVRKLFLEWRKMAEARFYFWLSSKFLAVVNPKNKVSVETLLSGIKWERRLRQWGRPKTVEEMEKIFDKFLNSHILLSWDGNEKEGYRFVKNREAFGDRNAKKLACRIIAEKCLEMFESEEGVR